MVTRWFHRAIGTSPETDIFIVTGGKVMGDHMEPWYFVPPSECRAAKVLVFSCQVNPRVALRHGQAVQPTVLPQLVYQTVGSGRRNVWARGFPERKGAYRESQRIMHYKWGVESCHDKRGCSPGMGTNTLALLCLQNS